MVTKNQKFEPAPVVLARYTNTEARPPRPWNANDLYERFMQDFAEEAQARANSYSQADDAKQWKYWHYVAIATFSICHGTPLRKGNDKYEDDAAMLMINRMTDQQEQYVRDANSLLYALESRTPLASECKVVRKQLLRIAFAFDTAINDLRKVINMDNVRRTKE